MSAERVADGLGLGGGGEYVFFRMSAAPGESSTAPPPLGARFVFVVGHAGLGILQQRTEGAWTAVYQDEADGSGWSLFVPRAIVDVDRHGTPEVIYHFNEYDDGLGHEVMLRSPDGGANWREVADNADVRP